LDLPLSIRKYSLDHNRFFLLFIPATFIAVASDYLSLEWIHILFKPLPALICAWHAFNTSLLQRSLKRRSNYLAFAFVFCSLGDLLLALEPTQSFHKYFFLSGMTSFVLAHSCFIIVLIGGVPVSNINAKRHWGQLATATLLLVFGVEFFILNRESFGDLQIPILIYCFILVLMSIAASMRMLHHGRRSYLTILFGVILFMTSDGLLATVRFTDHLDAFSFMILPTYFTAIGLMCYGFSVGKNVDKVSSELSSQSNIDGAGA
jgi:uncharacterized membrane protein YhhN